MKPLTPLLGAIAIAAAANTSLAANAPTGLRVTTPSVPSGSLVTAEFSWIDNSDDEDAFEWELRIDENSPEPVFPAVLTLPNQTIVSTVTGGQTGQDFFIRVRAKSAASGDSEWTEQVSVTTATTLLAITPQDYHGGTVGEPIAPYVPNWITNPNDPVTVTGFSIADLPDGLEFDPATGTITGTPTQAGFFRPIVGVTDGTSTLTTFVTFRFVDPPTPPSVTAPLPDASLVLGTPHSTDLAAHFSDPDTTSAIRFSTNRGDIDTILYPKSTPATVENFLGYVNRGDLDNTIFHRLVTEETAGVEVIQSGFFKPDGDGTYTTVTVGDGVINEPGISNTRGTIAMAKTSDPNSGTSQSFFNTQPNTELDAANLSGGFAVFGRAAILSLPVMDDIYARPVGTYSAVLNDNPARDFTDWPTNDVLADGAVPGLDDLVINNSITPITEFLTYSITGAPSANVNASIDGTQLTLTPSLPGTSTVTVTATDLDGQTASASFDVTVTHDVTLEPAIADVGGTLYPAVTFPHLDDAAVAYTVEKSADLKTWTPIWSTGDTFTHELVTGATTDGTTTTVTVRSPDPTSPCHFRIRTSYPTTPPSP